MLSLHGSSRNIQSGHVRPSAFSHILHWRKNAQTQFARAFLSWAFGAQRLGVLFEHDVFAYRLREQECWNPPLRIVSSVCVFIVQQTHLSDHFETCRYGFVWHFGTEAAAAVSVPVQILRIHAQYLECGQKGFAMNQCVVFAWIYIDSYCTVHARWNKYIFISFCCLPYLLHEGDTRQMRTQTKPQLREILYTNREMLRNRARSRKT